MIRSIHYYKPTLTVATLVTLIDGSEQSLTVHDRGREVRIKDRNGNDIGRRNLDGTVPQWTDPAMRLVSRTERQPGETDITATVTEMIKEIFNGK